MATVKIEFSTDNAAFDFAFNCYWHEEVQRVFADAARALTNFHEPGSSPLLDSNGNTVGKVTVE